MLLCLIDLIRADQFDVRLNVPGGTVVDHLLGLGNATALAQCCGLRRIFDSVVQEDGRPRGHPRL
jgi:hypothetical protein